ncbi:MAG: EFR1 family ferrodoxin [Syntrophobacteraceae bacterium]|nr:EFR1 family ferrodoxin [Syntrophobacteraceae bacterium]
MKHSIVYCSPNGATRHVAEVIADRIESLGGSAELLDLGQGSVRRGLDNRLPSESLSACLWVGSPVYVDHMVPPVERFLESLPAGGKGCAVPFVTWGGVNSGVALHEMGRALTARGYALLGAAKVLAVHSSMWRAGEALGAGHPDALDDSAVRSLVDVVMARIAAGGVELLPLSALNYQPEAIREQASRKSIAMAKAFYPALSVMEDRCTQCGECADKCPAGAITLNPHPAFGESCFLCFRCVRECPEEAIPMDMSAAEERIRAMALATNEPYPTRIFT